MSETVAEGVIIEYLKTRHTRQLMSMRKTAYANADIYNTHIHVNNRLEYVAIDVSLINDELKTREHVPNKVESAAIRKEKARKK